MGYLALKLGPKVPKGAINLAWVSIPAVSPEDNTFIADLASTIPVNTSGYIKEPLFATLSSYQVTLGDSGTSRSISSPLMGRYSTPIQVLPPVSDPTGAWHLRILDGVFYQRITVSRSDRSWLRNAFAPGTEVVAIYTLPEKLMTPHNTRFGDYTEFVAEDEAFPISSHSVQLSYRDVSSISDFKINGITIAFPAGGDGGVWSNSNMTIDPMAGTVTFLNRSIAPTDDVRVSYGHRSPHITYHGYYDIDGNYRDLNLNPAYGHTYDMGKPTSGLVGRVITLFLIPAAAYDYQAARSGEVNIIRAQDVITDQDDRTFLRWGSDLLGGLPEVPLPKDDDSVSVLRAPYGSARYGRDHFSATTPQEDTGSDNYSDKDGAAADLAEYPSAVILARVYIAKTSRAEAVIVTDTRRRGGGLSDDPVRRRMILNGEQLLEAGTCWDISGWDGDPVMLNGTTVIELPESMLTRRGGRFTEAEVEEVVKKRLPVGVLPIIRYVRRDVVDESAAVSLSEINTIIIQLAHTNIAEITSVTWDGDVLDSSLWDFGVNLVTGQIELPEEYNYPTTVLVSYNY